MEKSRKKLVLGVLAATVLTVLGGAVAQARADKYTVWHKDKELICVDDDSLSAHIAHGDSYEEGCADE